MKYLAHTRDGTIEFNVPTYRDGKILSEHERNLLAVEIAQATIADGAVVELGGLPMRSPAEIKAGGRMPTTDEIREFYDMIATPRKGDGWFGSTQHIDKSFGRTQYALKHIEPGMSIMEAGCADGGLSQHLVEAVGPDGFTTLIDISSVFVARAEPFVLGRNPGAKVEFVVGDAAEYKTRRRYDVIVAMEILEHVVDPRKLISSLFGLLRKDSGKIIVSVPTGVEDALGEHLYEFSEEDVSVILGDATGLHVSTEVIGNTIFAIVDKKRAVPYVR